MQLSVAAIMAGIEMWQGTGELTVREGGEECRLYFMSGKLYHAKGPGDMVGQAAVDRVMAWHHFEHSFDREARLPAVETIGHEQPEDRDDWRSREAAQIRARAVYVLGFLLLAALVMVWLFSQRN